MAGAKNSGNTPRSMTGFGRGRCEAGPLLVEAEIRSVNHRFLDIGLKLPRAYSMFESEMRTLLGKNFKRGRVELFISRTLSSQNKEAFKFDDSLFSALYGTYTRVLQDKAGVQLSSSDDLKARAALDILRKPEVLSVEEETFNEEEEKQALEKAVNEAIGSLAEMSLEEGKRLSADIEVKIGLLEHYRNEIFDIAKAAPLSLLEKLKARLEKLGAEVTFDPVRLAQEAAIIADRVSIDEELVRLSSHLQTARTLCTESGSGRKFDFLCQEIGREFNTIGSKAQSADIQTIVVNAKTELEKIREQVQNIE